MVVCTIFDADECTAVATHDDGSSHWGIWGTMEECLASNPQFTTTEPTSMPSPSPTESPTTSPTTAPTSTPTDSAPSGHELGVGTTDIYIDDLEVLGPRWVHVDASASEPEHILIPNGGPKVHCGRSTCENRIVIPVKFTIDATYNILLNAHGPTGKDDSFYVHVDGVNKNKKPFCKAGFNLGRQWGWHRGTKCEDFITVSGHSGELHEIVITPREDGSKLAGIRFTPAN